VFDADVAKGLGLSGGDRPADSRHAAEAEPELRRDRRVALFGRAGCSRWLVVGLAGGAVQHARQEEERGEEPRNRRADEEAARALRQAGGRRSRMDGRMGRS
jgi:hypothetical protein